MYSDCPHDKHKYKRSQTDPHCPCPIPTLDDLTPPPSRRYSSKRQSLIRAHHPTHTRGRPHPTPTPLIQANIAQIHPTALPTNPTRRTGRQHPCRRRAARRRWQRQARNTAGCSRLGGMAVEDRHWGIVPPSTSTSAPGGCTGSRGRYGGGHGGGRSDIAVAARLA